jgi:hypothetical protein
MDTSGTRDFNFTRRSDATVPRGILSQLCTTQSYYNKMVLTRARAGLPEWAVAPTRTNALRKPFVDPWWCRLTGGIVRGIVDTKEDPYDEYDD